MSKLTMIIVDSRGMILDRAVLTERELLDAQESPAKALMLVNKVNKLSARTDHKEPSR